MLNILKDELLDSMEAGMFLRMHASRLNALAKSGQIKSVKIGKRRLYAKSDLLRWFKKQSQKK